jgi:uncharacterized protein with PhoU and TrkA domain
VKHAEDEAKTAAGEVVGELRNKLRVVKEEVKELWESVSELAVKRKSQHTEAARPAVSENEHLEAVVQQPNAGDHHSGIRS